MTVFGTSFMNMFRRKLKTQKPPESNEELPVVEEPPAGGIHLPNRQKLVFDTILEAIEEPKT